MSRHVHRALRPRAIALATICVTGILVSGCGSGRAAPSSTSTTSAASVATAPSSGGAQGGASTAAPSTVASSFARYYLHILVFQDGAKLTAAQRSAAIRTLAPRCGAPSDGQYPCSVRQTGRPPSTQRCAVLADAAGRVETMRCTYGAGPAPIVRAGYTDCATVGHVVTVTDPPHDTYGIETGGIHVAAFNAHSDLLQVRVADTPHRFCVDFDTAELPGRWSTLRISLGPSSQHIAFQPAISYTDGHGPEVESGSGAIPGQVGSSGHWTSLLVTSSDARPEPLPSRFAFQAFADWEPETRGGTTSILDQTRAGRYP